MNSLESVLLLLALLAGGALLTVPVFLIVLLTKLLNEQRDAAQRLDLVVPLILWFFGFFGILIATWPNPPWSLLQWGSIAFMIGFPLLFYPMSHTLAIALDMLVRPPQRREGRESPGWRER